MREGAWNCWEKSSKPTRQRPFRKFPQKSAKSCCAQLVGMSPELPSMAELTAKRNGIDIDILSDAGNVVSERLGLVFELAEALRPIYRKFGIDIPDRL